MTTCHCGAQIFNGHHCANGHMQFRDTLQSAGITAPIDTSRHTAISCTHQTTAVRARMRKALEESSLMPLLSLRYPVSADLDSILDSITSLATAECITIMWEHSAETAAEYRLILKTERESEVERRNNR